MFTEIGITDGRTDLKYIGPCRKAVVQNAGIFSFKLVFISYILKLTQTSDRFISRL